MIDELRPSRGATTFATVAVVARSPGPSAASFSADLVRALAAFGDAALTTEEMLPRGPREGGGDGDRPAPALSPDAVRWLDRVESSHRYVVYLVGDPARAWSERIVPRADVVLDVVDARASEVLPPPWSAAGNATTARHLVVVSSAHERPSRASRWLDRAPGYGAHHHVRAGSAGDAARVARLLAGRAAGLVLSGGGERTCAFVGVLRALEEARVPVDVVVGTSGGALLGAMCALGWDWRVALERVREMDRIPHWRDLNLPVVSLLDGRVWERTLRRFFGDAALEDVPLPFLPVCANLRTGAVVVPARGPLWRAIRASASIPGVWPPVLIDGDLLVDGGLVNNVPVDLARERCGGGPVMAFDVSGPWGALAGVGQIIGRHASWHRLLRRLSPFAPPVATPGLFATLVHAANAASMARRASPVREADHYVMPLGEGPVRGVDELVRRGYEVTLRELEAFAARSASAVTSA